MPHSLIIKKDVDIYECPIAESTDAPQVTMGDLHGNAMLFIYFLVINGIFKLTEEQYEELVTIYNTDWPSQKDIAAFNKIINEIEVVKKPLVTLIGDEICDRGKNDYFMFKILNKLHTSGVKIEILLSNHGMEFITPYEKGGRLSSPNMDFNGLTRSLEEMRLLLSFGVISRERIDTLVKESYLPNLKLLSYSVDQDEITIYSHAAIGLETVRSLATFFKVKYEDAALNDLSNTIDAINAEFIQYVHNSTVHTLTNKKAGKKINVVDDPVKFILWNRDYSKLERHHDYHGYKICYVHGHDSEEKSHDNIFNLDGCLGKGDEHRGDYIALATHVGPLKKAVDSALDLGSIEHPDAPDPQKKSSSSAFFVPNIVPKSEEMIDETVRNHSSNML